MAEAKNEGSIEAPHILDDEDETTLKAIDRAIQAADENRVVSIGEVRRRLRQWLTKSSSPKTRS